MKRLIVLGFALATAWFASAQEFPVEWKTKFSFKIDKWYFDDNGKYVFGRTDEEAEVLDGSTGKPLWKKTFKKDYGIKTLATGAYNPAEGVLLLYNPDGKKAAGEKLVVDFATGQLLWRADQYTGGVDEWGETHFSKCFTKISHNGKMMVFNNATKKFTGLDIRTGKVIWESKAYPGVEPGKQVSIRPVQGSEYAQVFVNDGSGSETFYMSITTGEVPTDESRFTALHSELEFLMTDEVYLRKTVGNTVINLEGKMKKLSSNTSFTLEASGYVQWKQTFEVPTVRQLYNGAPYVKMDIQEDLIFVMAKEIIVFDLMNGKQLWKAPFDNCDISVGLRGKQEFGIAGWPLLSGNDLYYVDLQEDNAIKKVNARTGELIWKSDKLKSSDRVPNLVLVDGVLVAQFGGMINTQIYVPASGSATQEHYKCENRFDGNYEVRVYDPASGKLMWRTSDFSGKLGDKFKERISTIYPVNNKIVVASSENIFCLEPKNGNLLYKVELKPMKIGGMFEIIVGEDYETLYVFCDEGIASVNGVSGKVHYSAKTGEIDWKLRMNYKFSQGKNTFIWVGEKDFIAFDFAQGKVIGKMKDIKYPQFTADGNTIFLRDGSSVTRYTVVKK